MEEQVRGGLLPHETFLWGAVASATPLRGRCGGAAKERIQGRQGLEETRLPQTPAFSPSLLTGSSSHMFISTPRGTASAVSVRGKMKIEGSGCSARLLPALEYNIIVGIHEMFIKGGYTRDLISESLNIRLIIQITVPSWADIGYCLM